MPVWRVLLWLSAALDETGETQTIDATAPDRIAVSHYYANKTEYTFKDDNITALVECETSMKYDIHCEMKKRGGAKSDRRCTSGISRSRLIFY